MFVNLKNSSMFAVPYIVESGKTASNDSGFFVSDCEHIGHNTPLLMLNGSTALHECKAKGKVVSFLYFQTFKHFYSVMPYAENNVLTKNNSIRKNTPYSATTVSTLSFSEILSEVEKRFAVEKDCKNEAYAFILAMGLKDEFRKFVKDTKHIKDKHALCLISNF